MFDSLAYEIKKQNELIQQILDKGGLGVVIEGVEPVRPDKACTGAIDLYNYDKAKRQVSLGIGERVAQIIELHAEIKYFSQFIESRYKYFKELKEENPDAAWNRDIETFIKRYEEANSGDK